MFSDRVDAGNQLALKMADVIDENTVVLAIPRGGVVIGHQIAKRYDLQLDVIVSKKLTPRKIRSLELEQLRMTVLPICLIHTQNILHKPVYKTRSRSKRPRLKRGKENSEAIPNMI